ncbi:MAG: alanine--tRNA ligase [Anaerolineales bacterium]|nr:alanine--tRNA ligase [Anaerolineales bacterium]
MTSAQIRQAFLDYFEENKHTIVASSSLIPADDPTLLFTNAGMVQFKDAFLGLEERPYKRATTSQKCMRVSGKHNDLENVGPSPRHHTFFEMLGNFSLGDYFKRDAIRFAYECLTKSYGISPDRLYYTVHTGDDEAFDLWTKEMGIDPARVYRMGDKTNFWQMADVGPCGPTSELHYDWGQEFCTCGQPDCSVLLDNGCERWLEIWNLVFMQFNQAPDGTRTPLPKPGVDTGMGLERIVSVVQNKRANYETDLFMPIMRHIQALLGHSETQMQQHLIAYRVIADHGRAITFMIGDGVMPGNEGRASVLRLILRRAARYGRLAGFEGSFLAKIAEKVIEEMGDHYIELKARRQFILNVIIQEEERFLKTFTNGLELIAGLVEKLKAAGKKQIPGDDVFKLYATFGFPKDLTRIIADEEYGFTLDEAGYEKAFDRHTEISGGDKIGEIAVDALQVYASLFERLKSDGKLPESGVVYNPYDGTELPSLVVTILRDGTVVPTAGEGQKIELVLAATPFYIESGGQMGDVGEIVHYANPEAAPKWTMEVGEVAKPVNGLIVHRGIITEGTITSGDPAWAIVDYERRWDIMRNHTATHVLHRELRRVLGEHVAQAGSLVAPDRLRFDFSHTQMVSQSELDEIERAVNEAILADFPVKATQKSYNALKQAIVGGEIMALFGEKYGDIVRVVQIGAESQAYSRELCGGTHVDRTAQIGALHVTSEGSAAAGVRRIEAVTGRAAQELIQGRLVTLEQTAAFLGVTPEEVYRRSISLMAQVQEQEKKLRELQRKLARVEFERLLAKTHEIKGIKVISLQVDTPDVTLLREMSDWFRDRLGSGVVVLGAVLEGKPTIIATVTDDLVKRGLHAGKLIKEVAQIVGGGGGGKPTMAQAGGKDAAYLGDALAKVDSLVSEAVG